MTTHHYIVLAAAISTDDLAGSAWQNGDLPWGRVFADDEVRLPTDAWLPDYRRWAASQMSAAFGLSEESVTLLVEPATPEAPAGIAELFDPCPPPRDPQDSDERWPRGPKCPNHSFQVWPCAVTIAAWELRGADIQAETQRALNRLDRPWTTS